MKLANAYSRWLWGAMLASGLIGCRADQFEPGPNVVAYRERMMTEALSTPAPNAAARPAPREWRHKVEPAIQVVDKEGQERQVRALATTIPTSQPVPQEVFAEMPDPVDASRVFDQRAAELRRTTREDRIIVAYDRVVAQANVFLKMLALPQRRDLSLAECMQRAVQHNYTIRSASFNPAISETQIVQAEAAFDAVFFLDTSRNSLDRAHPPTIPTSQSDGWSSEAGVRKLLPTGMQASASFRMSRNFVDGVDGDQTPYNPAYDSVLVAQFRQPVLRGFGLDYNRRNITLALIGRQLTTSQFRQQVRDTLLDVERAYWNLVRARRTVSILAESVAQNWVTYRDIDRLQEYKATPVQLANAGSRYQQRYVTLLEAIKTVRDAEDRLRNLMNDPEFKLSDQLEIVPTEDLFVAPLIIDEFAEVRTALDRRDELMQAKLNIDRSRVDTAAAKNETLPQLDLTFDMEIEGLEDDPGHSFDNFSRDRFRSYTAGVQLSQPFGNRFARARLRETQLRESQAVVDLNRAIDLVCEEVKVAVRNLSVRYSQIPPQLGAAQSAALNLRALQTRAEQVDPTYLETELNTVENLANNRTNLLNVVADYTITLVELEKAKGTLLEYNNVAISDEHKR